MESIRNYNRIIGQSGLLDNMYEYEPAEASPSHFVEPNIRSTEPMTSSYDSQNFGQNWVHDEFAAEPEDLPMYQPQFYGDDVSPSGY